MAKSLQFILEGRMGDCAYPTLYLLLNAPLRLDNRSPPLALCHQTFKWWELQPVYRSLLQWADYYTVQLFPFLFHCSLLRPLTVQCWRVTEFTGSTVYEEVSVESQDPAPTLEKNLLLLTSNLRTVLRFGHVLWARDGKWRPPKISRGE